MIIHSLGSTLLHKKWSTYLFCSYVPVTPSLSLYVCTYRYMFIYVCITCNELDKIRNIHKDIMSTAHLMWVPACDSYDPKQGHRSEFSCPVNNISIRITFSVLNMIKYFLKLGTACYRKACIIYFRLHASVNYSISSKPSIKHFFFLKKKLKNLHRKYSKCQFIFRFMKKFALVWMLGLEYCAYVYTAFFLMLPNCEQYIKTNE